MWDPNSADKNFSLTVQFNKSISAKSYTTARDNVLLVRGVKMVSENKKARTMTTNYSRTLDDQIKAISGVESTSKTRISGFGQHGGCFGPRRGR